MVSVLGRKNSDDAELDPVTIVENGSRTGKNGGPSPETSNDGGGCSRGGCKKMAKIMIDNNSGVSGGSSTNDCGNGDRTTKVPPKSLHVGYSVDTSTFSRTTAIDKDVEHSSLGGLNMVQSLTYPNCSAVPLSSTCVIDDQQQQLDSSGQQFDADHVRVCPRCFQRMPEESCTTKEADAIKLNGNANTRASFSHIGYSSSSPTSPVQCCSGSIESRNPFYEVSNEYMRVSGYSQQFPKLLQKNRRRKAPNNGQQGAGGTAGFTTAAAAAAASSARSDRHHYFYTSRSGESMEGKETTGCLPHLAYNNGPQTTVIDMQPVVEFNQQNYKPNNKDQGFLDEKTKFLQNSAATADSVSHDFESLTSSKQPGASSPYGILWKNPPNFKRIKKRKQLFVLKTQACSMALLFAMGGIFCAIVESELVVNGFTKKTEILSLLLRSFVVLTTLVLLGLISWYHIIETQITVIDSGACDWQVTVTTERVLQLTLEILVCSVAPFPNTFNMTWMVLLEENHRQVKSTQVPLDSVLILPMFLRCYLICRFMALQSKQFQDAATRSIASLNRVAVDFPFVMRTMMFDHPLRVLCSFTLTFWIITAWIFMHCERQSQLPEDNAYLNSIWFIMITFKSIGYGDIVPNTYCGRALAITAGIVGAAVSSALIAIVSHKLELSRAEKHVNNFMADSKLTQMRKHTAAMVLQHTWFIHKYSELKTTKDETKLRFHQRRFLAAINEFRKVKWDQRKLAEQGNALVDLAKLQNDTYTIIHRMQQSVEKLAAQVESIKRSIDIGGGGGGRNKSVTAVTGVKHGHDSHQKT